MAVAVGGEGRLKVFFLFFFRFIFIFSTAPLLFSLKQNPARPPFRVFFFHSCYFSPRDSDRRFFNYFHKQNKIGEKKEKRKRNRNRRRRRRKNLSFFFFFTYLHSSASHLSLLCPGPFFFLPAQQRLPLVPALPGASPLRRLQAKLPPLGARQPQALHHGLGHGQPRGLAVEAVPRTHADPFAVGVGRRSEQGVEVVRRVRPVDQPPRAEDGEREAGGAEVILGGLFAGEDGEEVEDAVRELVGTLFFFFFFFFFFFL